MTSPATNAAALALDDSPASRRTVSYEGLDGAIIERSDSAFPPPASTDPPPDAWLEPPPLVSMTGWFERLDS